MPFWALLHFFTVFLSVSYLFGFAFAFYDRSVDDESKLPPLYKATLPSSKQHKIEGQKERCYYYFYFKQGSAKIEKDNIDPEQMVKKGNVQRGSEKDQDNRIKKNNFDNLEMIVNTIEGLTANAEQVRVILIGRADEAPTRRQTRYMSNYELSEARALNVKYEIVENLILDKNNKWRNIEWLPVSLSNESVSQQNKACVQPDQDIQDSKVVEAYIDPISSDPTSTQMHQFQTPPFERLDLMDYMYFSIYTITTTGYGDIVPTTPYAKFVASLANICEVFFVVGFFNALIALQGKGKKGEEGDSDTAINPSKRRKKMIGGRNRQTGQSRFLPGNKSQ